jgi:sec-independent protein translocase protein TatB
VFDINGGEFIILLIVAVFVIGPERMPEYAAKFARLIKQLRTMADTAKDQLREQMGPDFDEIDWKSYDPRQYDPRRIVREALMDEGSKDGQPSTSGQVQDSGFKASSAFKGHDSAKPTPFDQDAT